MTPRLAARIVSTERMRSLEAAAFASGSTEPVLQERAGAATADAALELAGNYPRIAVLAGHGNNGRDGAVAARYLAQAGARVDLLLGPRHAVTPPELDALRGLGVTLGELADSYSLVAALHGARVVVDAMLGIGAHGRLREPFASAARALNTARETSGLRTLAVDVPSGIDADSGATAGEVVQADCTLTFGAIKQGLLRFPAASAVGELRVADIGIPDGALRDEPYTALDADQVRPLLPARPLDAHKYRFGRVLVVAGSEQFPGASVLCATAAARAGAGLVSVASTPTVLQVLAGVTPEATYADVDLRFPAGPERELERLHEVAAQQDAVVIGPGLGRSAETVSLVQRLVQRYGKAPAGPALVIDADALYALATLPGWPRLVGPRVVLTPHAGELARLAGAGGLDETRPAWQEAARLSQTWGCVLVAKGPFSCVATPDGQARVWTRANPGLATGGTGDVLAGLCAGLLGQHVAPADAAQLAVGVHALAGQAVLAQQGWRTLLASDLWAEIPRVLASLAAQTAAAGGSPRLLERGPST